MTVADREPWFNRSAFGLAGELCARHPVASALTGPRRWVFLAMASFVGLGEAHERSPMCFASHAAIGERAGLAERAVRNALVELRARGLIEHTGQRITGRDGKPGPVKWRITLLAEAYQVRPRSVPGSSQVRAPSEHGAPSPARDAGEEGERHGASPARGAGEGPARGAGEGPARGAGDPRNPSDPQGASDEEDPAAPLGGSAGAPPLRSAAGSPSAETIAEIARLDGCSVEHAQRWAVNVLTGRTITTSADRYLIRCLANGQGPANWSPPAPRTRTTADAAGTAKGTPSARPAATRKAGKAAGPARTPATGKRFSRAEKEAAAVRVLSRKATAVQVGREYGRGSGTVQGWVTEVKREAVERVLDGKSTEAQESKRLGWSRDDLGRSVERRREERDRWRARMQAASRRRAEGRSRASA